MSNIIIQSKKCSKCGFTPKRIDISGRENRCWSHGLCGRCFLISPFYVKEYYHKNRERILDYKYAWKWNKDNRLWCWAKNTLHCHKLDGYITELTADDLIEKVNTTTVCRYCKNILNSYEKRSISLDRIDNGLTLTKHNIQIICNLCNTTKGPRTHEEFINYCKLIAGEY